MLWFAISWQRVGGHRQSIRFPSYALGLAKILKENSEQIHSLSVFISGSDTQFVHYKQRSAHKNPGKIAVNMKNFFIILFFVFFSSLLLLLLMFAPFYLFLDVYMCVCACVCECPNSKNIQFSSVHWAAGSLAINICWTQRSSCSCERFYFSLCVSLLNQYWNRANWKTNIHTETFCSSLFVLGKYREYGDWRAIR